MSDSYQQKLMKYMNQMDFRSQDKANIIYKSTILLVCIISYIIGAFFHRFSICIYSTLTAMIICLFIIVPGQLPWWKYPRPSFGSKIKVN